MQRVVGQTRDLLKIIFQKEKSEAMKCYQEIVYPCCRSNHIKKARRSESGTQRYRCADSICPTKTFMLDYKHKAYEPGVKKQIIDMTINSSGIRDISRVIGISKQTVISTLLG